MMTPRFCQPESFVAEACWFSHSDPCGSSNVSDGRSTSSQDWHIGWLLKAAIVTLQGASKSKSHWTGLFLSFGDFTRISLPKLVPYSSSVD